jgi:hypothetical protein
MSRRRTATMKLWRRLFSVLPSLSKFRP